MAELDQSYSELEQPQYQPEPTLETGTELEQPQYQPEPKHAPEHETKLEPAPEHEYEHEHANQHVHEVAYVQEHAPEDEIQENSLPDEILDHVDEPVTGGAEKWPGWPGESVFRILVPAQKVGSIIGRKGEYIKKTCEETKARIKILDGPPGTRERTVMVSAKEEPDTPLPPAIDGLLSIHKRVADGLDIDSSHPSTVGKVSTRLLMPASQAGSLIGKQGTTVKSIQEESNCIVRVLGAEEVPIFALQDDRIVEVVGEPTCIHKAIELIASHLRKFLVDRSIIPIIEMQMQMPNSQMERMPPPPQHWGPPPQFFPPNAHAGPGYGASPRFMPPPRQFDNYYPPADMPPPPEKQHHQGISAFGRETQIPVHSSSSQTAATAVITQVTQQMQIPLSYADAVIGTHGSSISYIRRVSGATVAIQETKGVSTEMTVEIGGTSSQVQTAQQLIQNFMAEAAASQTQTLQAPPPSADQQHQVYNSSSYGAPYDAGYNTSAAPANPTQGGGYPALGYGTNYGY